MVEFDTMTISIIIVVAGNDIERYVNLIQLQKALKAQTIQPHELIIVEQVLGQDCCYYNHIPMEISNTRHIPIKFHEHPNLFSVGWGRNVGIYRATGDIVVCLDVDYIFRNDYLEVISNTEVKNAYVGWSKIYYVNPTEKREFIQTGVFPTGYENYKIVATINNKYVGGSQVFNRQWFISNIVGYSEDIFGWGSDDTDVYGRANVITGEWHILDYSIFHLHHDRKQKAITNSCKIKERNCDKPFLTANMLRNAGVGNADHPNPIYPDSIKEAEI